MTANRLLFLGLILAMLSAAGCGGTPPGAKDSNSETLAEGSDGGGAGDAASNMADDTNKAGPRMSASGYDLTPITRSDEEWQAMLTDQEYYIARREGTEYAGTGPHLKNKQEGVYYCIGCGLPLYKSTTKYESGSGWPSYWEPFDPEHIREVTDTSLGMVRTEIECARCGTHFGHVFDDGPDPTGKRHCTNGTVLRFVATGQTPPTDGEGGSAK